MWTCSKCQEAIDDAFDACWNCGTGTDGTVDPNFKPEANDDSIPDRGLPPKKVQGRSLKPKSHKANFRDQMPPQKKPESFVPTVVIIVIGLGLEAFAASQGQALAFIALIPATVLYLAAGLSGLIVGIASPSRISAWAVVAVCTIWLLIRWGLIASTFLATL